jgi:hypothetical protein
VQQPIQQLGHAPNALAADPGFFSAADGAAAEEVGAKRVSIPATAAPGKRRKAERRERWLKDLQKRRTGCEGRIRVQTPASRPGRRWITCGTS